MAINHKSGLIITSRGEHGEHYDGDAPYVVWYGKGVMVTASYLPSLIRYLDMAREIQVKANRKNKKKMTMPAATSILNRRLEESK